MRKSFQLGTVTLTAILWLCAGLATADNVIIDSSGNVTVAAVPAPAAPALAVSSDGLAGLRVAAETIGLDVRSIDNKAGQFIEITWPDAATFGEIGAPALPVIRRLFIAPPGATLSWSAEVGAAVTIDQTTLGRSVRVMPVQPPVEKLPGALENAVFQMDEAVYALDADVSDGRVSVQELGIVRGQRLCLLEIRPVGYNPVKQVLTVYPQITADVRFDGSAAPRETLSVMPGLSNIVLNPDILPLYETRGAGNFLIVTANAFSSAIGSFVSAKQAQGFTVTTWVPTTPTTAAIKAHIQSLWGTPDAPAYVLLVGDTDTIPNWVGQGADSPATDLQYVCMDGASDWYPDIAIGRFPAATAAQLTAIVDKTLYYESGVWADPNYVKRAVFMASNDNYTVSEGTHNWVISTYMVPNEIVSDKLYCHTYNATTTQVTAAFNNGRFFGIYSGHGAVDYWADGPVFHQSDVNALVNANKYAFVCSFSCLTGQYTAAECFMETWVRAANKGAAAAWGSSVTSYWTEDDILEKKLFDVIYDANQPSVAKELGPVILETKLRYLAHFGSGGSTRRYFEMYNLFGDPALAFPGNCSETGTLAVDRRRYACESTVALRVQDCGLNVNPNGIDTVIVTVASTSNPAGIDVTLTETTPTSALFLGSLDLSATAGPGVLLVAPGDALTAIYHDANHGQGQPVDVTATATIDCVGPVISNVRVVNIQPRAATVLFDSSEAARGTVHYGLSCEALNQTATGGISGAPSVDLTGLLDNHTYYFKVDATDEAGNTTSDQTCYSFSTPEVPDFFTQLFTDDNDLDNVSVSFAPNGSVDFYRGCDTAITALPTSPTGGTPLTLTDDSNVQVNLTGGATVTLYGVSYNHFWVGSNGYITFGSGDSGYNEALDTHFSQPRISALFDDLDPSQGGGSVSWKQLADHVAVTWLNVPVHNAGNQNTFQIEMYFDGRLAISYLAVADTGALAGLSRGQGVPGDFLMSDLSALGPCQATPPTAHDASVNTNENTAATITLSATDDGLPNPPGALFYIITALPAHGSLADPSAGAITFVPYMLLGGGHVVNYTPQMHYIGADSFTFKATDGGTPPDGGDSNVATIALTVVGVPQQVYAFALDTNPGWTTEGQWAFGHPTGVGTHNNDPGSAHTGADVYGYNLDGDYTDNMPKYSLTTTALDLHTVTGAQLRFWRWLGVERFDRATVEVSNDGTNWTTIWTNPTEAPIADLAWLQRTYDISAVADGHATVYIRWGMGPTEETITYPGWNIDDIEIWGIVPAPSVTGDMNCDAVVNFADINPFVLALTGQAPYEAAFPNCRWLNADVNGDGLVSFADINPFVALLTGGK